MDQFDVYIPAEGDPLRGVIDPGSAIVASPSAATDGRIEIYYEGNRYGAANMRTYADRCRHAAGRLAHRSPTVARALVGRDALVHIGTYTPALGVTVDDERAREALARWLDRCHPEHGPEAGFDDELRHGDEPR